MSSPRHPKTVGEDIRSLAGFSSTQLAMLAKQAAWIAEAQAGNELTPDLLDFFLDNLAAMARNFVKVLQGLTVIMIEKAWNAAVGVIWSAIEAAIGVALPLPNH
ncbi:hypothetical protein VSX64_20230 [Aurantimonas sp. C2-6-R+9]|nr:MULTISPECIES: hypothetical protein [unclassified Aurantimonas]MEC5383157.1 hypothetical protein [Aurantimonas sp. C2-6-R+9]MEC5414051.1 hypothetical protein [Aurantimonas sp. C2-4-R8]